MKTNSLNINCLRGWTLSLALTLILTGSKSYGHGDGFLHLGPTGYASLSHASVQDLNYTQSFSAEVALHIDRHAPGGRWPVVLGKMRSPFLANPGFAITINQGQFATPGQGICAAVADGSQRVSVTSPDHAGLVHATLVWNAPNRVLQLYVNGEQVGAATNSLLNPAAIANDQSLVVGDKSAFGVTLQRDITLARLWNRALSGTEVANLWKSLSDNGKNTLPTTVPSTSLHSQWISDQTVAANGAAGSTHWRDTQSRNHLELFGNAAIRSASTPLALASPANLATGVSKSARLIASGGHPTLGNDAQGPLQYEFQLDESPQFNSPNLRVSPWIPRRAQWKPLLKPDTTYYWRARVRDASTTPRISAFTPASSFTTAPRRNWYARPSVHTSFDSHTGYPIPTAGVYGQQNGTSYANAWNGLQSVVWGEGGVEPGDTLYVCGTHLHTAKTANFLADQALVRIRESGLSDEFPITIRMDATEEPGVMWGAFLHDINGGPSWTGPDANGVYTSTSVPYGAGFAMHQGNLTLLDRATTPTWTQPGPAAFQSSSTWYVKMPDAGSPAGRVYGTGLGYRFHLGRHAFIHFINATFLAGTPEKDRLHVLRPGGPTARHITFDGCRFQFGSHVPLYRGQDDWTFRNCNFSDAEYGIYTMLDMEPEGSHRLTVQNCQFVNLGTTRFPHADAHAIGVQGGEGHLLEGNDIRNTGTAIEFWTGPQPMRNHVIRNNFIRDIKVMRITGGSGIVVSGENTTAVVGLRTGFQIYGNVIVNVGLEGTQAWQGSGIGSNTRDYIEIFNNTIVDANNGIRASVTGEAVRARIVNNVIVRARHTHLTLVGSDPSPQLEVDYNLFFPATDLKKGFSIYPSFSHNQNAVLADPLLLESSPSEPWSAALSPSSPAINAGTTVSRALDILGSPTPRGSGHDIGAVEFQPSASVLIPPANLRVEQIH